MTKFDIKEEAFSNPSFCVQRDDNTYVYASSETGNLLYIMKYMYVKTL